MAAEEEDLRGLYEDKNIKDVGLIDKYMVYKLIDTGRGGHQELVPVEGRVFVLKPETDTIARIALRAYAARARIAGFHKLADDIHDWLMGIQSKALTAEVAEAEENQKP